MTEQLPRPVRRVITLRVDAALKQRIHAVARQHGQSEAATVLRAVRTLFGIGATMADPTFVPVRQASSERVTVRLRPDDSSALRARARARRMPDSTYVAALVRAHLSATVPLPSAELAQLKETTGTLALLARTLRDLERQARIGQPAHAALPTHLAALRVECVRIERAFHDFASKALQAWEAPHGRT